MDRARHRLSCLPHLDGSIYCLQTLMFFFTFSFFVLFSNLYIKLASFVSLSLSCSLSLTVFIYAFSPLLGTREPLTISRLRVPNSMRQESIDHAIT